MFGCYDETQYRSIDLSNFGCSDNFQVKILHENSVKHEFCLRNGQSAHIDPLVLVPKNS